ncbi:zeta toxin family protein [Gordoniibacillus kamchatkensis]|uniref:zeta toxin family protein n=1 Tax=Gordoniibacillus kamchatkensis TaxID=1590651 RepID=UPI000698259A|nr:zeta toxin family protein [Paenibacillus sp. VKM B-2647]
MFIKRKGRVFVKSKKEEKTYYPSERYAYKVHHSKDPIYIPVNRINTPFQTDEAIDEEKVKENIDKINNGEYLDPIIIGYKDYVLHDGHHRLEASKRLKFTHVPCIVGGRNERRVQAAEKRYRRIWKNAEGSPIMTDPTHTLTMYHATWEKSLKFVGDRPIKNYNQIGSWFTSDPEKAREYYGPYVHEVQALVQNPLEADTDDFDKFFYNPDIAPRYLKLGSKKSNVTREDMTELMDNPRYIKEFKNDLVRRGYDAIVWKNSTIDLPPDGTEGRHTVTILLHPEKQIKSQKLLPSVSNDLGKSTVFAGGRLLIKKNGDDSEGRWVTIRGHHVKINSHGEIIEGNIPDWMKGKKLKSRPVTQASKKLTPYDTPEVIASRNYVKKLSSTHLINTPERIKLRKQIVDKLYGKGAKQKNRRIDIVIGPPAAGKSSVLADPLAKQHGALLIDADKAKEELPEFEGGLGANAVHEESSEIIEGEEGVLIKALRNGDNIVLPIVGRRAEKLRDILNTFKELGYEVHLHLNELSPEKAARRAVERFKEEKRFVDPHYVLHGVGWKPSETYDILKKEGGFDSYEKYSNDVPRGQKPILIERHSNLGSDATASGRRQTRGTDSEDFKKGFEREAGSRKTTILDAHRRDVGRHFLFVRKSVGGLFIRK